MSGRNDQAFHIEFLIFKTQTSMMIYTGNKTKVSVVGQGNTAPDTSWVATVLRHETVVRVTHS